MSSTHPAVGSLKSLSRAQRIPGCQHQAGTRTAADVMSAPIGFPAQKDACLQAMFHAVDRSPRFRTLEPATDSAVVGVWGLGVSCRGVFYSLNPALV